MNTRKIHPAELYQSLKEAALASPEERAMAIQLVLDSDNRAVIRRIPEALKLDDDEQMLVLGWAKKAAPDEDRRARDFAFHLLLNCEVDAGLIVGLLEEYPTGNRSIIDQMGKKLLDSPLEPRWLEYLKKLADILLSRDRVSSRDQGWHTLIQATRTEEDWHTIAVRLTTGSPPDMRQKVFERVLRESPQKIGKEFARRVITFASEWLATFPREGERYIPKTEVSYLHWWITCIEYLDDSALWQDVRDTADRLFGEDILYSVSGRLPNTERVDNQDNLSPDENQAKPNTNAQGEPQTVEDAIELGWTITHENGRQVVLRSPDGTKSITKYRPK